MWKDKFDNVFLTKDEVMQDVWENMDVEDYFEYGDFDPVEILKKLIELENDFIIPKMRAAEDNYLAEHYEEFEEEEEEEEANICKNCGYYYKTEINDFPGCHCIEPEGWAPCEYEDEK